MIIFTKYINFAKTTVWFTDKILIKIYKFQLEMLKTKSIGIDEIENLDTVNNIN
jgi:hypothetical protein